jgi:spermidine synthase
MIISLALLGYGVSGTLLALARPWLLRHFGGAFITCAALFSVAMPTSFVLGQRMPFNALEVMWDLRQWLHLLAVYLLFFVPFLFAASCTGLAFIRFDRFVGRIYLADLLGAGSGALAIILALFMFAPQHCLQLLVLVAMFAAILATFETAMPARHLVAALLASATAALLLALPPAWLELRISPYKGLSQALQIHGAKVLSQHSNALALLTVVESPAVPFRYVPGLSITSRHEPPPQLGVYSDGDSLSVITRYSGQRTQLAYLDDTPAALPYQLLSRPAVLILGAGGGADVLLARYHQARAITAVELNPAMLRLVRETYADFAGHLYSAADIDLHVAEARGFVARSRARYDLVQVALLDSFAAAATGVQGLNESYLYTVEALQEYLRHLSPGGVLAITRWLKLPPRDSLKLFVTAIEALKRDGVAAPAQRLALIRDWQTVTLLVKHGDFSAQDIDKIREFCRTRAFDVGYYPGMSVREANRFNRMQAPYLFEGAMALLGAGRDDFIARYKFYIAPATDDRPHFFHFFKWSALPELLALRTRGGASLVEWGYLVLLATVTQAVLVGLALILMPLLLARGGARTRAVTRMGLYFFAVGLAFLFVEIAFIQKFILFLSHPLYAVAVVLSGFLVFAGLGSGYSTRLTRRLQPTALSPIALAVAGVVAIALVYLFALPVLTRTLVALPDAAKITLSLALIAPLAFCMGMPFPLGLARLAGNRPDLIPWAWGINGFASVLSAALAALLAVHFGFTIVVTLALALYVFAAVIAQR